MRIIAEFKSGAGIEWEHADPSAEELCADD
jgi:hypothetical protein